MFKLFRRFHPSNLCIPYMESNSGQLTSWYISARTSLNAVRQSLYVGIGGRSIEEDVKSDLDVEDVYGTECLKELSSKCHAESPNGTRKRIN